MRLPAVVLGGVLAFVLGSPAGADEVRLTPKRGERPAAGARAAQDRAAKEEDGRAAELAARVEAGLTRARQGGHLHLLAGVADRLAAAEYFAGKLGRPLYRVDLCSIVSKYVGETEQQLVALFDKAAAAQTVLFVDNADALFGRRDPGAEEDGNRRLRGAARLLERLEVHQGQVLLAVKEKTDLDAAFRRRMHSIVELPAPPAQDRRAVWESTRCGR